jgi:hypothetical protein
MMMDNETAGQYVAKVLSLVGALVTGDPIEIEECGHVQVTGIAREVWPDSPVMVTFDGESGERVAPLDHVKLA